MIETMSGSSYKDLKSGASGTRSKSNLRSASRVSFSFSKSGSDPASENVQQTSRTVPHNATHDPAQWIPHNATHDPAFDDPISSHMSEICDMINRSPTQLSKDSYTRSAKEMYVPRHKPSITTTFLSMARIVPETSTETTDMPDVSGLSPHRSSSGFSSGPHRFQRYIQAFQVPIEQLLVVKNSMQEALERGLKFNIQGGSSIPVIPTFVCALPDGTERGHFLALEMTQTHVNVLLLNMIDADIRHAPMKATSFPITEDIRKSTVDQLFEFLAGCLEAFLREAGTTEKYIPLGFCFPFACKHMALNKCYLLNTSKNFWWTGMEGKDVAEQLQTAINTRCKNFQIEVAAVVNDTVGTMLSGCSEDEPCEVGLVIDAGCNSCYMELTEEITGIEDYSGCMCVNTEWGAFGKAGELDDLMTEYDTLMDKQSMHPGEQSFEKLIGSLYICDTVRIFLAQLAEKGDLFNGVLTPTLLTRGNLDIHKMAEVIDERSGISKAKNVLFHMGMVASNEDCFHFQEICQVIFDRSASLCAAGLAGILTRIAHVQNRTQLKFNVAVDGIVYNSLKQYRETLHLKLKSLVPEYTVTFIPTNGSCALGVIMATAAAIRHKKQRQQMDQILKPFRLSIMELERMQNMMRIEMTKGLSRDKNATVQMLPTFVRHLPNGSEKGTFLALDLGGTNFRVLMVELKVPKKGVNIVSETYVIPPEIAQSSATELFDHIVNCIVDFETKNDILTIELPLGFTFSFPCRQVGLDKGILLTWTKGFSATGCVGQDVVQLLREALHRQERTNVDVVAIVNDTVGTMMSCAFVDPKCEIGLIAGTGTNACYMEEMKNVSYLEGKEGKMCINTEWGAFGDGGCLDSFMTSFDVQVDTESLNAGQRRFEKLISGMYLGEIVRLILLELTSRKVLFRGQESAVLQNKGAFPTKFLSEMEDSKGEDLVRGMLQEYNLTVTGEDARLVKEVCRTVSTRAAKMCGAGVAAIVERIRENRKLERMEITIGADGTLYKAHPRFSKELQETVTVLAPKCQVKFMMSEDGSGKGAALVAAIAHSRSASIST